MPVGIPTSIVERTKKALPTDVIPTVNMWCAHTPRLTNAIPTEAATMAGYPKIALRENTGITSLAIPNAGITSTYTSGCARNQKRCCQSSGLPPPEIFNM